MSVRQTDMKTPTLQNLFEDSNSRTVLSRAIPTEQNSWYPLNTAHTYNTLTNDARFHYTELKEKKDIRFALLLVLFCFFFLYIYIYILTQFSLTQSRFPGIPCGIRLLNKLRNLTRPNCAPD